MMGHPEKANIRHKTQSEDIVFKLMFSLYNYIVKDYGIMNVV